MPIAVFGLSQTFICFLPNSNMEGKSSTQNAEIGRFSTFLPIDNVRVERSVSSSEFEIFYP